jgi:uncharacterized membrane protein
MNSYRAYWLALLFMALNVALLVTLYGRLPDPVPLPWIADGVAKPLGALLLPLAHWLVTLMLIAAPSVDPGAMRTPDARRFYAPVVAIISAFFLFATGMVFAASLDSSLSLPRALLGGVGVLAALVGNYLGKIPKNYVVGIRTPWTLASDYVWERTHRFAAPLFVIGGSALFLHAILQKNSINPLFVTTIIIVTVLAPFFYSYVMWKRKGSKDTTRSGTG